MLPLTDIFEYLFSRDSRFFYILGLTPKKQNTNSYFLDHNYVLEGTISMDENFLKTYSYYPTIEKNANINLLIANDNFWSIMTADNLFFYYLIIVLILPLIYCLLTLLFLLKNQIKTLQRGKINLFENKNPNFTILTRNYWRVLWSYVYDLVP